MKIKYKFDRYDLDILCNAVILYNEALSTDSSYDPLPGIQELLGRLRKGREVLTQSDDLRYRLRAWWNAKKISKP